MKLTYRQIEQTLASHLQIQPDRLPTLQSRVKQLQRLGFPPGVNVGRRARMTYTAEHMFQLVTAFELLGFGLPAQTACNLVTDHWAEFSAGYSLAALQWRALTSNQMFAVVWAQSMHEIQFNPKVPPRPSTVKIYDELEVVEEIQRFSDAGQATRLVVSLGSLLRRILKIASEQAGVSSAAVMDEEFNAWLPKGANDWIRTRTPYPDRSNTDQRHYLNQIYRNDEDCLTTEGLEEARKFAANGYSMWSRD